MKGTRKHRGESAWMIAQMTGYSEREIARKAPTIPGSRRMQGHGPGSGWRFADSPALSHWIKENTLCDTARNTGPGRKGEHAKISLVPKLARSTHLAHYGKSWDEITTSLTILGKYLPKKIRKMMSLRGCTEEQIKSLRMALEPIWNLRNDVAVKLGSFT